MYSYTKILHPLNKEMLKVFWTYKIKNKTDATKGFSASRQIQNLLYSKSSYTALEFDL